MSNSIHKVGLLNYTDISRYKKGQRSNITTVIRLKSHRSAGLKQNEVG